MSLSSFTGYFIQFVFPSWVLFVGTGATGPSLGALRGVFPGSSGRWCCCRRDFQKGKYHITQNSLFLPPFSMVN